MDTAFHLDRLLLAAVFALAGVAKLADRRGTRRAVVDFGIPGPWLLPWLPPCRWPSSPSPRRC